MEDCIKIPCQIRLNMHKIPVKYTIEVKNRSSTTTNNVTHTNVDEMWKAMCDIIMECRRKHIPRLKK